MLKPKVSICGAVLECYHKLLSNDSEVYHIAQNCGEENFSWSFDIRKT